MVPAIWNSESNAIGAKAREEPANEACRGEDFIDELRSPRHLENLDRRGLKNVSENYHDMRRFRVSADGNGANGAGGNPRHDEL
jgi:hypothetical protein